MTQLIHPRLGTRDGVGWCLRFAQSVYGLTGAPYWHESAWKAWLATEYKHTGPLPDRSVPVWFSHWGTYGSPARYDNWGHVVAYVPGRGFLSSPAWLKPGTTAGQGWYSSTAEVEAAFGAKYVGWSEDLNGHRIINYAGIPGTIKESRMSAESYANHLLHKTFFKDGDSVGKSIVKAKESAARAETLAAQALQTGPTQFYKHGGLLADNPLWIYVYDNGDFRRVRDITEAHRYKELNGGRQATVLSTEAIRMLVADLQELGGRDLSDTSE